MTRTALARVYILQGRYDEAIAEMTRGRAFSGGSNEPVGQLGYAYGKAGQRKEALKMLDELE